LALRLGMTVRELSERMDRRELADWVAYFRATEDTGQRHGSVENDLRRVFGKPKN
jgi:hypothetical protein